MSNEHHDDGGARRRHPGRKTRFALAAAALFFAGAISGAALVTATGVSAHTRGFYGHHGHHGHRDHSKEEVTARAQKRMGWLLEDVDATPEQIARIDAITAGLIDDLYPMVAQHRARRQALVEILGADEVRREDLEGLRAEQIDLLDSGSARIADALADAAAVLEPEQRAELLERMGRFRH